MVTVLGVSAIEFLHSNPGNSNHMIDTIKELAHGFSSRRWNFVFSFFLDPMSMPGHREEKHGSIL